MRIELKNLSFRQQIALKKCNIDGVGLEIGPSFNPIAPKRMGFNIEIMDHLDKEGLVKKYLSQVQLNENIEDVIENVDYVWKGQSYVELIGETKKYDYIISSHLIEHVPDLIQHLNDCSQILKDNGVYSLIIPDKRYTFDFFRQLTTAKDCISAHQNHSNDHSSASCVDYYLNAVSNDNKITWLKNDNSKKFQIIHGIEEAKKSLKAEEYLDIHESVFIPSSFELLITDLNMLELIDFCIESIETSIISGEFYVTLRKNKIDNFTNDDRIKLLKKIENENMAVYCRKRLNFGINQIKKIIFELFVRVKYKIAKRKT